MYGFNYDFMNGSDGAPISQQEGNQGYQSMYGSMYGPGSFYHQDSTGSGGGGAGYPSFYDAMGPPPLQGGYDYSQHPYPPVDYNNTSFYPY